MAHYLDVKRPSEVGADDTIMAVVSVRFEGHKTIESCYSIDFWQDSDSDNQLWIYRESLGVRGVVHARSWESAYGCVEDEIMDDAECQCTDSWRVQSTDDRSRYLSGGYSAEWTDDAGAGRFYTLSDAQEAARRKERDSGTACAVVAIHRVDEDCPFHGGLDADGEVRDDWNLPEGCAYRNNGEPSNPRLHAFIASWDLNGQDLALMADRDDDDTTYYVIVRADDEDDDRGLELED